jgi:tetraacyldisaccharide 4'-kinase
MVKNTKSFVAKLSSVLLLPGSWLYSLIVQIRNLLYNLNIKKTHTFATPIISLGNLSLGGTGKTPCIAYLIPLLQRQEPIIVLSRGYKRTTRGFKIAQPPDTALTIGDEPFQIYRQFASQENVKVAVSEDRAQGITQLLNIFPHTQVILLDDGFQHRKVKPSLNILLTEFGNPFFTDYVVPAGRLREPRGAAQRADVILVTKCPELLSAATKHTFKQHIYSYCQDKKIPIFFTRIRYHTPTPIWPTQQPAFSKNILLITGIANPTPLVHYVSQHYNLIQHVAFRDHHIFTNQDIQDILVTFDALSYPEKCILTTEKDSVRFRQSTLEAWLPAIPIFYLPMSMEWLEDEKKFKRLIFESIADY